MSGTNAEQPVQAAIKLNREGKFQEALALVAPLVEKGDKQPNAYLQMSRALRGMKDDKAAREVEQRALELFPDNPRVAAHVGNLFASADKEYVKAADIVGTHLAAGRIEPDLVAVSSIALRGLKRDSEADAIEVKGLAQNPNNVQLLVRRAIALNRSGKFADAISLLAGKEAIVEGNATLKTHLQRAREGLAAGKVAPTDASATTTAGAAQPAAAPPERSAPAMAAVAGHAPATVPANVPTARTATMAAPAESAKEAQNPTAQSVPASVIARPATPPAPSPTQAQSATASPQSTPRSAALGSIPTVPAPAAQVTRPQPPPSAPPAPAPRAPEIQSTVPKSVPTTTSVPASAAPAATARPSAAAHPTMTAAASRQQTSAPAHRSDALSTVKPRSGISAFGVIFWGLVIVAAGLLGAHFAELIDLAPFAQQVSAMIEAARGN